MQYALMKVANTKVLIDALELQAITIHTTKIQDVAEVDENNLPLKVVYGAYFPQFGETIEQAIESMNASNKHWLGYVRENQCFKIGLTNFQAYDHVTKGHSSYIPFSALVSTHVDLNRKSQKAVTAFLRYENLRPDQNIFNRKGLFAINAQENRIKNREVTEENWTEFVDKERALLSATKIF